MKGIKKFLSRPVVIVLMLVMAVGLLIGTGVQGTQAVLNETSSPFHATMEVSSIDVALLEDGNQVARNGYNNNEEEGKLHLPAVNADKKLKIGYAYPEQIKVENIGSVPQFVRVTITKYWTDGSGKRVDLKPELIELDGLGSGWQQDHNASTTEREVYYYQPVLGTKNGTSKADKKPVTTSNLTETIRISKDIMKYKNETKYDYNDLHFHLEAKVDAVQNHHVVDAVKNAWGINVTGNEEFISLVNK